MAADRLRSEALELPEQERADLAADLLASLGPPQIRTDAEWIAEVERRAREALSGKPGLSWEETQALIDKRLGRG